MPPSQLHADDSIEPEPSEDPLEALVAQCIEFAQRDGERGVDSVCSAHPEHAARLRARLGRLRQAGLLDAPIEESSEELPRPFGSYTLLRKLGHGGMGVVYLARDDRNGHDVALKLLPLNPTLRPRDLERFRREIRALVSLVHTGIVRAYEGDVVEGVAYFAMEYVDGRSFAQVIRALRGQSQAPVELTARDLSGAMFASGISNSARGTEPSPRPLGLDRLGRTYAESICRVIAEVADALQHAHDHGVVHRDVKPSNILVDSRGRVRLIDFGLARIEDESDLTKTGDFLGTLNYVAPEQLEGRPADLDARVDIYSLGVTLYQLLTLRLPFEGRSPHELARRIAGEEPMSPRVLNSGIPRDLETICLTAISKDRDRRYASAGAMAADLRRLLESRTIEARPVGNTERIARFVRRNPAISSTCALAFVLVVGVPSIFAVQEAQNAKRAQAAARKTESYLDVLLNVISQADPLSIDRRNEPGAQSAHREESGRWLDGLAERVEIEAVTDPTHRVRLWLALAHAYCSNGFNDRALTLLTRTQAFVRTAVGNFSAESAALEHELGVTLAETGDYESAEEKLASAMHQRERLLGDHSIELAETLHELAWVKLLKNYGRADEAGPLLRRALSIRVEMLGDSNVLVAQTRAILAMVMRPGELEGGPLVQEEAALRVCCETLGDNHPRTSFVRACMGGTRRNLGDLVGAEEQTELALAALETGLGSSHALTRWVRHELHDVYFDRGRYHDAERLLRGCLPDPDPHPGGAFTGDPLNLWELANVLAHEKRYEEAEEFLKWAFTLLGADPSTAGRDDPAHPLAVMREARGEIDDAVRLFSEALEFSKTTQGSESRVVAGETVFLANALREQGKLDEAERLLRQSLDICERLSAKKGEAYTSAGRMKALETLAEVQLDRLNMAEAEALLRESLQMHEKYLGPSCWATGRTKTLLAECMSRRGASAEAEALALEGFRTIAAQLVPEHEEYGLAHARLQTVQSRGSAQSKR